MCTHTLKLQAIFIFISIQYIKEKIEYKYYSQYYI